MQSFWTRACLQLFLEAFRSSDLTVGVASCALWHQNLLSTQRPYKAAPVQFHNRSQPPRQEEVRQCCQAHQSKSADTSTREPRHWSAIDLARIRRINASERLATSIDRRRGTGPTTSPAHYPTSLCPKYRADILPRPTSLRTNASETMPPQPRGALLQGVRGIEHMRA